MCDLPLFLSLSFSLTHCVLCSNWLHSSSNFNFPVCYAQKILNNKITRLEITKAPSLLHAWNKSISRHGSGMSISVKLLPHLLQKTQVGYNERQACEMLRNILLVLLETGFTFPLSESLSNIGQVTNTSEAVTQSGLPIMGYLPWISVTSEHWTPDSPRYNLEARTHCHWFCGRHTEHWSLKYSERNKSQQLKCGT